MLNRIVFSTALMLILNSVGWTQPVIELLSNYFNYAIWDAAMSGNYVYVACGEKGLKILNVTNLSNPVEIGVCNTPGFARAVKISGNYAYVADMTGSGIRIIDVFPPAIPAETGYCITPGQCFALEVVGDYIYVADGTKGLQVVNITNPFYPHIVSNCPLDGDAIGIAVQSQYAYVASYLEGLQVVDVSDPYAPVKIGHCQWQNVEDYYPRLSRNVTLEGNYAYVADYGCGLRIIDITDPTNPFTLRYIRQNLSNVYDAAVVGNYAYLAQEFGGLRMVNITNLSNPLLSSGFITGPSVGVTVQGEIVLLCSVSRLSIFRVYLSDRD